MNAHSHEFDQSDYPMEHKCYNVKNKKIPCLMKDESKGNPVVEFIGLRAKQYSERQQRLYFTGNKAPKYNKCWRPPTQTIGEVIDKKICKGVAK